MIIELWVIFKATPQNVYLQVHVMLNGKNTIYIYISCMQRKIEKTCVHNVRHLHICVNVKEFLHEYI